MNDNLEKEFNVGGNIETALSGQYELKASNIIKEAWQLTIKNFLSFSPTIVVLILLQITIFIVALKMQLGDPSAIFKIFEDSADSTQVQSIIESVLIANFSYEVISAPLFAGVCIMAMSHATGFKTQIRHILKGFQFTIPVMLMTLMALMLQGIAGMVLPFLSLYLSMAFSNAVLLICEKRITPMRSLLLSLRAVNKKILPVTAAYALILLMFFVAALFYGIGLIFVLPFYFHIKGIIYRDMFGVKLKVINTGGNPPNNGNKTQSQVFDA
ncbi:hypothetical protein [Vibrio rumoiensis]|uniref:Proline and glycine rich transmembrane protein gene in bax n=1 Tax=Vibrio rumoiensis 1S-45 TaxID=1188252 RepID=A0A1E5E6N7_9VIBR|nr:hypothetical protein [Vibrio rumoiensis]OEF30173.1 hypothetical protein A1QC_00420 [Vibrio rumoiensis 1S-45]